MERHVREPERSGEVAEMASPEGRKGKIVFGESEISTSLFELKTRRLAAMGPYNSASPASSGDSTCESVSSGNALASCCSSSRSSDLEKESPIFADLEENAVAGYSVDYRERRETTPASEVTEPGELESTAMPLESNSRRFSTAAEKMPTEIELEEFLAAAEKNLQTQFIHKYNFDIVKDESLEGRYEWVAVQLKP